MARPPKKGADYFPLDVNLNDKFKLLEAEYGLKGFAIVIKLFQKIYANGYFNEFMPDVMLLFADNNKVTSDFISEVLSCCFRRELFDKAMYDNYKILTSRGIQRRYLKIKERSESVVLEKQYLLLTMSELPKNVTVININEDNNRENDVNNAQRKEKKNKEKNKPDKRAVSAPKAQTSFDEESQEMILARYLFKKMRENNPEAKEPNFQTWAKDFDLILRIDKRKFEKIQYLIGFAQWHSFWKTAILSPSSLRKNYDTLTVKMMEEMKKKHDK